MDDCLRHLTDSPEDPGDETLVMLVKLHRILEDVVPATAWRFDLEDPSQSELPSPMLYVRSMVSNLKAVCQAARSNVAENSELDYCI